MPSPEPATCAGCGCVCDDIELVGDRVLRTCPLGDAWFAERLAPAPPPARVDGREATLAEALDAAAGLLARARAPALRGLAATTCEAQRVAVGIADALGATIDAGAGSLAYQELGASTATLGEIRDRPGPIVVWRADPVSTHPRLLERIERARHPLVVVDERRTATAEEADEFVALPAGRAVEALWTLRALARDLTATADGLPRDALASLAARLRGSDHGALLHAAADHLEELGLFALVRDLGRHAHVVTLRLRREANAAGAEDVLAWQTGFAAGVSLASGHPRADPYAGDEADAALVLGDRDARGDACAVVSVGAHPDGSARVAIATAAAGVGIAGVVHRMDGVPVALRAPRPTDRPGDAEVLAALAERLAEAAR